MRIIPKTIHESLFHRCYELAGQSITGYVIVPVSDVLRFDDIHFFTTRIEMFKELSKLDFEYAVKNNILENKKDVVTGEKSG